MEKGDKIQRRQEQTQKYGGIIVAAVLFVGTIFLLQRNGGGDSSNGSNGGVHEQTLRLQSMKQNRQAALPQSSKDFSQQKAKIVDTQPHITAAPGESRPELEAKYKDLDGEVRAIKKTGVIMETDPASLKATGALQAVARKLIVAKYGPPPYRVQVDLEFPATIPDFATGGKDGMIMIELAPIELIPVSVFTFLEVSRSWVRGAFHRNANHVLQVQAVSSEIHQHLPFQEYSKDFPHKKGTTGYCGRPSGPCWYVSILDNTRNHGPGSQQQKNPNEADANFGTIVEGFDDVVPRIHSIQQDGWLDEKNQIKIIKKTVLISDGNGGFVPWKDSTAMDSGSESATE